MARRATDLVAVPGILQFLRGEGHLAGKAELAPSFVKIGIQTDPLVKDETLPVEVCSSAFLKILQDSSFQLENVPESLLLHERAGLLAADASRTEHDHGCLFQGIRQPANGLRKLPKVTDP